MIAQTSRALRPVKVQRRIDDLAVLRLESVDNRLAAFDRTLPPGVATCSRGDLPAQQPFNARIG
jgi:hypothetical protein